MKSAIAFATLMCLSIPVNAGPLDFKQLQQRDLTGGACGACSVGPWAPPTDCPSYSGLVSSLNNPPASISFDPKVFCSNYIQPSFNVAAATVTATTEAVDYSYATVPATVTSTDLSQPTGTIYCPTTNSDSTCGLDSDTIPGSLNEDWDHSGPVNEANDCHQTCLSLPDCKSFRVELQTDPAGETQWICDIFGVALGKNGSNVPNSKPGNQWFDRDCPDLLPAGCNSSKRSAEEKVPAPAAPVITPAPVPRDALALLGKRDWTMPEYIRTEWGGDVGFVDIQAACSCIITSALPAIYNTYTWHTEVFTGTTKITETITYTKTIVVTPHQTTIYKTVS